MAYTLYLSDIQLPIPPSSIETKINNKNETITLINDGEVSILKNAGLTEFTFDILLPQVQYPFASYPNGFKRASYYLEHLEKLKLNKKPFQFIISRVTPNGKLLFDTNFKVSLEEYTIKEEAENGFDIVVSISLKQYREYSTKEVKITIKQDRPKPVVKPKPTRPDSSVPGNKPVTIGCNAIINGQLHRDSYGSGPGQWRTNYRGKINFINLKGSHPYHCTTPQGGWQGWVVKGAVRVI